MGYKFRSDIYVELTENKGEIDIPYDNVKVGLRSGTELPDAAATPQVTFGKSYVFKVPDGKKMYAKVIGPAAGTELDFEVADFHGEGEGGEDIEQLSEQLENLLSYVPVTAVEDVYAIDIKNAATKNISIETEDTAAKTITLMNVPTRCELLIELTYTNECAITWFSGISWLSGVAPTFYTGKLYKIAFETSDGGANWRASVGGSW